jgi:iron complex outermembrane receptor protein
MAAHMFHGGIDVPILDPLSYRRMSRLVRRAICCLLVALVLVPTGSLAQTAARPQTTPAEEAAEEPPLRVRMPDVTVTAQKEPEDKQRLPVSVTAVSSDTIRDANISIVSDAALYAPNTFFTELTARKLSNPRFRGIGSSPNNPAITTYIDGVPQLTANSSSLELLDIDQIELVRGPQSALFGRNTLGGLVNITTSRPSSAAWRGRLSVPFGNHGAWTVRGSTSGPVVADRLSAGVSFAQVSREGFTVNDLTGKDLDHRSAFSGKGQLLWTPSDAWEARVIVTGERARDGDYALHDLAALRQQPFRASRDFEGHTDRDVMATTVQARRTGSRIVFSTTTGLVRWTTQDVTDLDYSPGPFVTRDNAERDLQLTQEVRFASVDDRPVVLSDRALLKWQGGIFLFAQDYDQEAVNHFAPFLLSPSVGLTVRQHSPRSRLDDRGLGIFGQGTLTLNDRLDVIAGGRVDYEKKRAVLETFSEPSIVPPTSITADRGFSNVSPQVSIAYRLRPDQIVYGTVGRGFKAGGFNPVSPAGSEAYDEEHAWHVEAGVKTTWANGRLSANAAAFFIDWNDLQLNVPDPLVPAQFYIANVGGAVSRGVELEVSARPAPGIDLFTSVGYTHARFATGSRSAGVDVGGNELPSTPDYTASAGLQYSGRLSPWATFYGRAEVVFYGSFHYDDTNTHGQDAYSLANVHAGVRGTYLLAEVWVRNAFDTRYIPVAFPYEGFAPSGFVGEMGAPRALGLSAGVRF